MAAASDPRNRPFVLSRPLLLAPAQGVRSHILLRPPIAWVFLRWPSGASIGGFPGRRRPFATTKQFMEDLVKNKAVPPISEERPGRYVLLWGTRVIDLEPDRCWWEVGLQGDSELTLVFLPARELTPASPRGSDNF